MQCTGWQRWTVYGWKSTFGRRGTNEHTKWSIMQPLMYTNMKNTNEKLKIANLTHSGAYIKTSIHLSALDEKPHFIQSESRKCKRFEGVKRSATRFSSFLLKSKCSRFKSCKNTNYLTREQPFKSFTFATNPTWIWSLLKFKKAASCSLTAWLWSHFAIISMSQIFFLSD